MRCGTLSHDSVCDINPLKFRTGQKEMKPFFSKVCHTHRIHKMRNNDRTTLWVPFLFHHYPPEWHLICPNTSLTSWTTYSSIPGHFEFHRKWNWLNSTKKQIKTDYLCPSLHLSRPVILNLKNKHQEENSRLSSDREEKCSVLLPQMRTTSCNSSPTAIIQVAGFLFFKLV